MKDRCQKSVGDAMQTFRFEWSQEENFLHIPVPVSEFRSGQKSSILVPAPVNHYPIKAAMGRFSFIVPGSFFLYLVPKY